MVLESAEDIDIIGRTQRSVTGALASIEAEADKMSLAVNESKTKYMLSIRRDTQHRRIGQNVTVGSYNFEVVRVYLGSAFTSENDIYAELKRRITLANRCFFGLRRQFSSRALSQITKEALYKVIIIQVPLYGTETWTLLKANEDIVGRFERKIYR